MKATRFLHFLLIGFGVVLLAALLNDDTSAQNIAACVPAPAGLVSWWPGDGNADDIAGTHDGTLHNGATFAAGLVAQAFQFDGVDDYVDVGPGFDLDAMTLDAWVFD